MTDDVTLDMNHQQMTKHGDHYTWRIRVAGTNDFMTLELDRYEQANELRAALFALFPDAEVEAALKEGIHEDISENVVG